jgi:4-hydroxybenzoate polyprenyltransferase/phosphoserine phosphatase
MLDSLTTTSLPLVVDLDGTLLLGDVLHEQIMLGLFSNPLALLRCLWALRHGRVAFKSALAAAFPMAVSALPVRAELVDWLRQNRAFGRELHLCTASRQEIAEQFAAELGIFSSASGSQQINLKGEAKAEFLVRNFPDGFVYAGDSRADLAVWRRASGVVLAGAGKSVERAARAMGKPVEASFPTERYGVRDWISALRLHHWSKNALVFLPLILAHQWHDGHAALRALFGFMALVLLISCTYLINDLADLAADRAHWSKCHRPIAAGRISIHGAFGFALAGIAMAMAGSFMISPTAAIAFAAYLVTTLAYSFGLKQIPLLDTFIIAFLFTLRLVIGTALAGVYYSEWLLAFSMTFFFSLAMAKRHGEILRAGAKGLDSARGYRAGDTLVTGTLGISTGVGSCLIIALFFANDSFQHAVYRHIQFLWAMPLFIGILIGRVWLLAQRGEMEDDPVSFVLRDKSLLCLGAVTALVFLLAL